MTEGYRLIAKDAIEEGTQFGPVQAPQTQTINPTWTFVLKVNFSTRTMALIISILSIFFLQGPHKGRLFLLLGFEQSV